MRGDQGLKQGHESRNKSSPWFTGSWVVESEGMERIELCRWMVTLREMVEEKEPSFSLSTRVSVMSLVRDIQLAFRLYSRGSLDCRGLQDLSGAGVPVHCAEPLIWHLPRDDYKLVTLPQKYHEIYTFRCSFVMTLPRTLCLCTCITSFSWRGKITYSESLLIY